MTARILVPGIVAGGLFLIFAPVAAGVQVDVSKLPPAARQAAAFERDIKPVLERSCLPCHGPTRPKSHFRVDSREGLIKGGESDRAGILPGNSAGSPLVHYTAGLVKEMEMPPLDKREKYPPLAPDEIGLIRAWIDQGATWPPGVELKLPDAAVSGPESPAPVAVLKSRQPFFDQIRRGDREGIRKSLRDRSLLDMRDENGNTPLIQAAFYLDAKQLALFLDAGADINATNNAGVNALMKAVWDIDKTRLILRRQARVNSASLEGNTPLIIACRGYGSATVVSELLAHAADVDAANRMGGNAVMAAAEAGDARVLGILLDRGGDPNSTARIVESNMSMSALMIAAQLGHLDCVKLLLDRGADLQRATEHGNALHSAVFTDRRDVVRLLLDRGIDVNATGRRLLSFRNDTGLTPLMYAAMNENDDPAPVRWLIERGAQVNSRASSGETALSVARLRGATKIVSTLLAAGAQPPGPENEIPKPGLFWSAEQIERPDARLTQRAAEAGVSLLLKSSARLTEATGNRCFTCHQHSQPSLAWSLAREKGLDYPAGIAGDELNAAIRAATRRMESVVEGPAPVPSIAAWLLVGLKAAGYPADPLTDDWVYSLARYQYADGRWITKACRPPTDYSDVTSTALAIRALKVYAPPTMKSRFDPMIAKAARWLRGYRPQSTEERALQLLGLYWAGDGRSELARFARALLEEQRADGGWAQISTLESDPYATGLSLFSLNQAGGVIVSQPSYQRGIQFLLKNQLSDGSWFVRTRASPVQVAIDDVFSHGKDQWISSAATTWSSMALMLTSGPAPGPGLHSQAAPERGTPARLGSR